MTIPGVGYYIELLVKAEIGDINPFRTGDQLASYAGLAPSTHSSGGVTHHGRITKEGSQWLRWTMVEAAHVHFRFDSPVTRAYHRIAERRGKSKAKVAAARMLLHGLPVGAEELAALLLSCSRSGVEVSSCARCPA